MKPICPNGVRIQRAYSLASLEVMYNILKCNNKSKLNCKTDKLNRYVSRV